MNKVRVVLSKENFDGKKFNDAMFYTMSNRDQLSEFDAVQLSASRRKVYLIFDLIKVAEATPVDSKLVKITEEGK